MLTACNLQNNQMLAAAGMAAAAAAFVSTQYGPELHQKMESAVNVTLRALAFGQVDALPESKTLVETKTQDLADEMRLFTGMIRQLEYDAEQTAETTEQIANRVDLIQERSGLVDNIVQAVIKQVETNAGLINDMGHKFEQFSTRLDEIEATVVEMKTDILTNANDIVMTKEGVKENKQNICAGEEKTQQNTNAIRELQQQQEYRDVAQNSFEKVVDLKQQQENLRNKKNLHDINVNATFGLDQDNLSNAHQQQREAMVLQQNYEKEAMELRHQQAQVNLITNCNDEIANLSFAKDLNLRNFADIIDNEIAALEAKKQFAIEALKSSKE